MANDDNYKSYKKEFDSKYDKALDLALNAVAVFVLGEAQDRTPVDTGLLRSMNETEAVLKEKAVYIGNNTEYALNVERGTSKQRAQPYMEPAVMQNMKPIQQIFEEYLRKGLED